MSALTTAAREVDLIWIAPPAAAARLVEDLDELRAIHAKEPWRVRVTPQGEAAFLARWREHLDHLAVLGLWCREDRVGPLVADLERVARDHGFGRLLGPLVPEEHAPPFLAGGLTVLERVLVLRLERPARACPRAEAPAGVTVRPATPRDLEGVIAVDAGAFDDFWRYDEASLRRYAAAERLAVAEREGRIIGYTLAMVRGGEGTLGRLAVAGGERGRGTGRLLVCEAVAWMAGEGARAVMLSTQEHNTASRRLYGALGFRELPGVLVATISGPLDDQDRSGSIGCHSAGS
jgi:ribosomal-protein-alanine N-acetyltransferase